MKTLIQLAGLTFAAGLVASVASAQLRNDGAQGPRLSNDLSARSVAVQASISGPDAAAELKSLQPVSQQTPARKVRVIVPSPYLQSSP